MNDKRLKTAETQTSYKQRRCAIKVTWSMVRDNPHLLLDAFQGVGFMPLHIETRLDICVSTYHGFAYDAPEVPEGELVPEYIIIVHNYGGKVTYSLEPVSSLDSLSIKELIESFKNHE